MGFDLVSFGKKLVEAGKWVEVEETGILEAKICFQSF